MVCRKLIAGLLALLSCSLSLAAPLPETGANVHQGVASCSNSICHGKVSPDPESPVQLNEYRIWLKDDHSGAYKTLLNRQSKAMARKLGLENAQTAKICRDCHTDNVAEAKQGLKFQVSDGVGCEACHGGSGKWLESHAEAGTSHEDNLAKGMYPTEQPLERARLCLSCHLGTKDKFATHRIMGAGHPRLVFDLEVFTENQPRHYTVDEDYKARKPYIPSANMWLAGLLVSSIETMELLQSQLFTRRTMIPELSFYQCHACHHPMSKLRWQPDQSGLEPGSVPLNDASLLLLTSVLESLDRDEAVQLRSGIVALHQASLKNRDALIAQAKNLQQLLIPMDKSLVGTTYTATQMKKLRAGLVKRAAEGRYRHYTVAQQAFMAVETLTIEIGDENTLSNQLDAWYETMDCPGTQDPSESWIEGVSCEDRFEPLGFAENARRLLVSL